MRRGRQLTIDKRCLGIDRPEVAPSIDRSFPMPTRAAQAFAYLPWSTPDTPRTPTQGIATTSSSSSALSSQRAAAATAAFAPSSRHGWTRSRGSRALRMSSAAEAPAKKPAEAKSGGAGAGYSMDDIVNVCKRRGFVFQSSEIYNGFNGFYDYGPLGGA